MEIQIEKKMVRKITKCLGKEDTFISQITRTSGIALNSFLGAFFSSQRLVLI